MIKETFGKLGYIFDKSAKRMLVFLAIISVIGSFLELMGVSVFMPFIDIILDSNNIHNQKWLSFFYDLLGFNSDKSFLIFLCGIIIFIYVFKNMFLIWQKNYIYKFSFDTQKNLATKLLDTYMKEPYIFHLSKNVAELQRALSSDVTSFTSFIMQGLELVAELCVCFVMIIYLMTVSKTITLMIALLMGVVVIIFAILTRALSRGLGKDCQAYNAKIYQWINQSIGGVKELKVLGREKLFLDSFNSYYDKYSVALRILRLISMIPKYIVEAVCMTGLLAAIIIKLLFGEADMIFYIPQLTVFAVASFRLLPSVGRINGYITQMNAAIPSVDLIYNDLRDVETYQEGHVTQNDSEWELLNEIRVDNVSFRYPDGAENVLTDVSLSIPKGKTVAFVGPSGAGKSTLADIILGILEPTAGNVYSDEIDIHKNLDRWHEQIGYIPQAIYLSDDSIKANIAFGIDEKDIDMEALERAAKQAQLDELIKSLPGGFDSFVGDRGVRLSGGQRQRIGIARALYHNPEILVLDEATSALDNETETAVMEAIESLHGTKTMIIIAHRLTTIRNADIIYEINENSAYRKQYEEIFKDN